MISPALIIEGKKTAFFLCKAYLFAVKQGQLIDLVDLLLIPFYSKTTYISLSYENSEKEFREIGVIKDMAELDDEQYKLLDSYLEYKYYMPEITKVYSIKDNMRGAIFVKADTTSGQKTICIRDWYQNFRMIGYDYLYVNDADGNKYFCPDIHKLDRKSRQVLEMYT